MKTKYIVMMFMIFQEKPVKTQVNINSNYTNKQENCIIYNFPSIELCGDNIPKYIDDTIYKNRQIDLRFLYFLFIIITILMLIINTYKLLIIIMNSY